MSTQDKDTKETQNTDHRQSSAMMQYYLHEAETVSEYIAMGGTLTKVAKKKRTKERTRRQKEEISNLERQLKHKN
ncbi:hypothetical protein G7054_g8076 [Neopestalotiopsis clavispora]|nr:hypothetical protein G7054_g8076 [Neopestalotiopsis clavispora]